MMNDGHDMSRSSGAIFVTGEAALQKNFYVCAYARFLVALVGSLGPWLPRCRMQFESKSIGCLRAGKLENR